MSARRRARAGAPPRPGRRPAGAPPRSLALGPCAEVWAADASAYDAQALRSARWRYAVARRWWLAQTADPTGSLPAPAGPWSARELQALGRSAEVTQRLSRIGCKPDDLDALRREAADLHRIAYTADDPRLH